ncbi:Zn-ribbon domain-containing OB-fold protein [Streptomyces sp. NPDC050617]|uniref:Zn-ribbon domain-containing OB-fold protein n=1 Tax=Streptomyces sp. NPDC050617 TaxID=3154628 RepID=UPI00341F3256
MNTTTGAVKPFAHAPEPTPETLPFWEGARAGELRIQRCRSCTRHYFDPRPHCRHCASADTEWTRVSGRARLVSYIINHRPAPGFRDYSPVIAMVQLDEGPTLMSNIVGVEPLPENLPLDMPLEVRFEERGETVLPVFAPAAPATSTDEPNAVAVTSGSEETRQVTA